MSQAQGATPVENTPKQPEIPETATSMDDSDFVPESQRLTDEEEAEFASADAPANAPKPEKGDEDSGQAAKPESDDAAAPPENRTARRIKRFISTMKSQSETIRAQEAEIARLKAEREAGAQPTKPNGQDHSTAAPAIKPKPNIEDFDDVADYEVALEEWVIETKVKRDTPAPAEKPAAAPASAPAVRESAIKHMKESFDAHPPEEQARMLKTFQEVGTAMTPNLVEAAEGIPNAAELLYELAKSPADLKALSRLRDDVLRDELLARAERMVSGADETVGSEPDRGTVDGEDDDDGADSSVQSASPTIPVIQPARGSSPVRKDPSNMTQAEYNAYMNEKEMRETGRAYVPPR